MRLDFKALLEKLDGIVPLHIQVAGAGLFPNAYQFSESRLVFAAGLVQELEGLYRLALAYHADGVERTVDETSRF